MTREAKVGLMMVAVLVGVFGFMIYKRVHRPNEGLAAQTGLETTSDGLDNRNVPQQDDDFEQVTTRRPSKIVQQVEVAATKVERAAEDFAEEISTFTRRSEKREKTPLPTDVTSNDDDFAQFEAPRNTPERQDSIPMPATTEEPFDDFREVSPPPRKIAAEPQTRSADPFSDDSSSSSRIEYEKTPIRQVKSEPFDDEPGEPAQSNELEFRRTEPEVDNSFNEPRRTREFESDSEPPTRIRRQPAPVTLADDFSSSNSNDRNASTVDGPTYTIQPNDNFWTISRKRYGAGRYYLALAQHNRETIPEPKNMKPGLVISTPDPAYLEQHYAGSIPKAASNEITQTSTTTQSRKSVEAEPPGYFMSAEGHPMYRVGGRDTLTDIAKTHLGRTSRWVQILEMNRNVLRDGNELKIGTVLRLPADASRVRVVGTARDFR